MKLLITGGAGFIGSHTVVELLNRDYELVILDDFSNSDPKVLDRIEQITSKNPVFYEGNVCDKAILEKIFQEHQIDGVIHFAGYKAVGESVKKPLRYYDNNLISTLHLLEMMEKFECYKFVFSSSATVYGNPKELPIKETAPLTTTNPYGTTKLMIEQILRDVASTNPKWSIAILRYFNPIGAHESGLIGENPKDIPNNLMPYILKVATKELDHLNVFGNDYPTQDGTGVRDYLHVVDLALGHVKAIAYIEHHPGIEAYNLGTGEGHSVLEIVKTFEQVNQVKIPYEIVARREGDIAACYADATRAHDMLGWSAEKDLETMCRDAYHFLEVGGKE